MNVNELGQYKCHLVVRAAKITGVEPGGLAVIVDLGKVSASIAVPEGWVAKHNPLQGDGYLVAYEDGYLSWSPAESFEAGYHRIPELGIACGSTANAAPAEPLVTDMPPHQLRVLEELAEVGVRLQKLNVFINDDNSAFSSLPDEEQGLLRDQVIHMSQYQDVLARRVAAFC